MIQLCVTNVNNFADSAEMMRCVTDITTFLSESLLWQQYGVGIDIGPNLSMASYMVMDNIDGEASISLAQSIHAFERGLESKL
jgi:hypothetical protein